MGRTPEVLRGVAPSAFPEEKQRRTSTGGPVCPACHGPIREGESTERGGNTNALFHLRCRLLARGGGAVPSASRRTTKRQAERAKERRAARRAEREERSDAAAQETMRSHKPSTWRLGKSPGDFA